MKSKISLLLFTAIIAVNMVACQSPKDKGKVTNISDKKTESSIKMQKPESISMLVNGNLVTSVNARDEWEKRWEELTGIDLEITQPDHDAYNDVLGQIFASGEWPDVVFLGANNYPGYASEDVLWDMTEAFENSTLKKSGRINSPEVVDACRINDRLYGMPNAKGTGTITYIKKAWLDKLGIEPPTNFEEYMNMLKAFTENDPDGNGVLGDTYGLSAAGVIAPEAPWIQYLPEFYQDAYPTFLKDSSGKWVDGFLQENMKPALMRLKDAYEKGYIEKETLTNGTKDVRNKFFEDKFGVFTYWAGKWNTNIKESLEANGLSGELVAIPPIEEVPSYIEKIPNVWCITNKAENPQAIWDSFFETMLDGGDMQVLWTYGVKGVHWDDKEEELLGHKYKEGEFHMLESLEVPGTQYTTAHIDPLLSLVDFVSEDPGVSVVKEEAKSSRAIFDENKRTDSIVPPTEEMAQYNGDLQKLKNTVIANVVTQGKTYEEEMKRFKDEGGEELSQKIIDSLNNK